VPMPRHMFGELTRSIDGCSELTKRNIVFEILSKVRSTYDSVQKFTIASNFNLPQQSGHTSAGPPSTIQTVLQQHQLLTSELKSMLWSLGHIGSNDLGLKLILNVDPSFFEWCIDCLTNCVYYNLRGVYFYVLGLLSRSALGSSHLMRLNWDYSDLGSNSAVAVPKNTNILFPRISVSGSTTSNNPTSSGSGEHGVSGMRRASLALSKISIQQQPVLPYMNNVTVPNSVKIFTPFLNAGSISAEQEAVNLVVKVRDEVRFAIYSSDNLRMAFRCLELFYTETAKCDSNYSRKRILRFFRGDHCIVKL
jgi:hypothetical protein